jgi:putative transposase
MLSEKDKRLQIATFRFGVISEFVTGVKLHYGEKERLVREKIGRTYDLPFSSRSRIARSTVEKWINDYKKAGFRLEGLEPRERSDKGKTRALSAHIKLAIKELKKEDPHIRVPAIVTCLQHRKLIAADEILNPSTVYRYLAAEELTSVNEEAKDKRHFEASHPNEIWQSDVMHGPYVRMDGKSRKSYLIAIIDDHSRFIVHAEFYLAETLENFLDCLRQGILKRGLPQKLYIDNGSCFKALHLEQIAAQLGIGISHSRPYTPQGRGKIERWFKFVRDNFLGVYQRRADAGEKLDLLSTHFTEWVDGYNNRVHSTTKQAPYDRYRAGLECVRPAPLHLLDYFRLIEFRRVKKDRTIRLHGVLYEVPVGLIDRQVELRYHFEDLSAVEIFFQGRSYGMASVVNPHVNAKIGRNWGAGSARKTSEEAPPEAKLPTTGQLFGHAGIVDQGGEQ